MEKQQQRAMKHIIKLNLQTFCFNTMTSVPLQYVSNTSRDGNLEFLSLPKSAQFKMAYPILSYEEAISSLRQMFDLNVCEEELRRPTVSSLLVKGFKILISYLRLTF